MGQLKSSKRKVGNSSFKEKGIGQRSESTQAEDGNYGGLRVTKRKNRILKV